MKAITLWQPWASMIAIGCKTHETRSWSTFHRGPIAIHAAKRFYEDELIFARGVIRAHKPIQDAMRKHGMSCLADFPLGAIVAVVDIVDIIPSEKIDSTDAINYKLGDFTPGRFAWVLKNVRKIESIPCIGKQGIWNLPDSIADLLGNVA